MSRSPSHKSVNARFLALTTLKVASTCATGGILAYKRNQWVPAAAHNRRNRSRRDVLRVRCSPEDLPQWAARLTEAAAELLGDQFVAASSIGEVTVKLVPPNGLGVLDYEVILSSGAVVSGPLRMLPTLTTRRSFSRSGSVT